MCKRLCPPGPPYSVVKAPVIRVYPENLVCIQLEVLYPKN
jgi:hypothetical protein